MPINDSVTLYFYPRSPCGERLENALCQVVNRRISIHALLAESDAETAKKSNAVTKISIHALLAESDVGASQGADNRHISIHALLAESDHHSLNLPSSPIDFYPRSPCGERRITKQHCNNLPIFLSTLSLRRATSVVDSCSCCSSISIHALLAESDARGANRVTPH